MTTAKDLIAAGRFQFRMDDLYTGVFGEERPDIPTPMTHKQAMFMARVISEELSETLSAVPDSCPECAQLPVIAQQADGLIDIMVFCLQGLFHMGLNPDYLLAEVHAANLRKAGGYRDESGKWRKPAGWTPPDMVRAILDGYKAESASRGLACYELPSQFAMFVRPGRTELPDDVRISGACMDTNVQEVRDLENPERMKYLPGTPSYTITAGEVTYPVDYFGLLAMVDAPAGPPPVEVPSDADEYSDMDEYDDEEN